MSKLSNIRGCLQKVRVLILEPTRMPVFRELARDSEGLLDLEGIVVGSGFVGLPGGACGHFNDTDQVAGSPDVNPVATLVCEALGCFYPPRDIVGPMVIVGIDGGGRALDVPGGIVQFIEAMIADLSRLVQRDD
jgi:hypothetical protein